ALIAVCHSSPLPDDNGKYNPNNDGRYRATDDGRYHASSQNEGIFVIQPQKYRRYHHMAQPYTHVSDHRELGVYHHIPYPYDGGYGPYSGLNLPYVHDDRPYNTTTKKPTTTTKRTTTTTTTTTTTPRNILFNYDDEGGHKILHQEEVRHKDKYDHAYLTENGIYGEEQAKLHHTGGTHAKGYYEYTGDDGKLYRVNYASNDGGFMPQGDHIHPIPDAIARALKYIEEQHKANGGAQFDHRGFRINHMTKDIKAQIKGLDRMHMTKELTAQIRMLEHEVELAEEEEREEQAELERQRKTKLH
ncbi:hypothetical protein KR054_005076, partial [Drosophila jambulina]